MNSEFYETIEEIKVYQKKQTTLSCIRMAASTITLIIFVAVMIIFVPKALSTMEHFNATLSNMDTMVSDAGKIVSSAKNAAGSENGLNSENMEGLAEAIQKINSIDFDRLNESINSLADVVSGLSRLTGFFGR